MRLTILELGFRNILTSCDDECNGTAGRPLPRLPPEICHRIIHAAVWDGQHQAASVRIPCNMAAREKLLSYQYDVFPCCGMIGRILPDVPGRSRETATGCSSVVSQRRLSREHLARDTQFVQSHPDDWVFVCSLAAHVQIRNSVAPDNSLTPMTTLRVDVEVVR
eukprot:SAG31_NODE_528_length_14438_cov_2.252877_7_plen_164_part_00